MRNGQNKRMRGRNRKGQNPLTRVYELNGPDVKICGTASHVADKYVQLARDAQASGDPVAAENYFQHAEHYFRLIAAAQEQFRQANPYYRPEQDQRDDGMDDMEDEGAEQPAARRASSPTVPASSPICRPRRNRFHPANSSPMAAASIGRMAGVRSLRRRPASRRPETPSDCPHSSPAGRRRPRRSPTRGRGTGSPTASTGRPTASRCIVAGAAIVARAAVISRARSNTWAATYPTSRRDGRPANSG